MKVLAIEGGASRELLSFGGAVIVHDGSTHELEFLFPKYRDGQVRFIEVDLVEDNRLQDGRMTMWLRDHPDMDTVEWPLDPAKFVPLQGQTKEQENEIIAAGIQSAAAQEPTEWQKRRSGLLAPS